MLQSRVPIDDPTINPMFQFGSHYPLNSPMTHEENLSPYSQWYKSLIGQLMQTQQLSHQKQIFKQSEFSAFTNPIDNKLSPPDFDYSQQITQLTGHVLQQIHNQSADVNTDHHPLRRNSHIDPNALAQTIFRLAASFCQSTNELGSNPSISSKLATSSPIVHVSDQETGDCIDLSLNGKHGIEGRNECFPNRTSLPNFNPSIQSPSVGMNMESLYSGQHNIFNEALTTSHYNFLKREASTSEPQYIRLANSRSKNRKAGFQAGVTVGYTYDAFFVSDGRSRRRGMGKFKSTFNNHKRMTSPGDSGLTNLSSSASSGQSTCSANSSNECCGTNDPTNQNRPTHLSPLLSHLKSPSATSHLLPMSSAGSTTEADSIRYTCPECGKTYATSSNLSRHKQTHRSLDSQAARKCPHCNKVYVSMPALSMHILTHDLKHRCDMCGKAFSRPWLLQGHRRAHTGEKPYGCAHCGRAFADRSNLRAHMQTHSGMKQYECPVCRKNFALKSYLNKHLESSCMERLSGKQEQRTNELAWGVTKLLGERS